MARQSTLLRIFGNTVSAASTCAGSSGASRSRTYRRDVQEHFPWHDHRHRHRQLNHQRDLLNWGRSAHQYGPITVKYNGATFCTLQLYAWQRVSELRSAVFGQAPLVRDSQQQKTMLFLQGALSSYMDDEDELSVYGLSEKGPNVVHVLTKLRGG